MSHSHLTADQQRLAAACHHDPFALLGHRIADGIATLLVFRPDLSDIAVATHQGQQPMQRLDSSDFFQWSGPSEALALPCRLAATDGDGRTFDFIDPYGFPPCIPDFDLGLFTAGEHLHIYRFLGAHRWQQQAVDGVLFATWAPNATRISVVGDFNRWDGRCHPMRSRGDSGVWELFIPGIDTGSLYKFELRSQAGDVFTKTDPYGQQFQLRPETSALVTDASYRWRDETWMQQRADNDWLHAPMSVYEVHLGSWQRDDNGDFLDYNTLGDRLADYLCDNGYTHIELMPVNEHPLDISWGYQTTGYFAPSSRFGTPSDFRRFVDKLHQRGIGVLLDWVPAHFPKDAFALARFDGSPLYEHEDPRRGEHPDWGTLIFNYGRNEVRNFLISNAIYWLQEYHIDGLRVDAVASMLYLDYSREADDWLPNQHGGRENLEAIHFMRQLNTVVHRECPGANVIAEESTAWPMVTRPTTLGGLGFSMKWNMGWMHDTLGYMAHESIHRSHHHQNLTFGLLYLFSENFVLPLSHDEVVHGKGSLLNKMPGDDWQRFANLRLLYSLMWAYPGKKLLFMGGELAQRSEWNCNTELDWNLLEYAPHRGVHQLIRDLNHLYRQNSALHQYDFEAQGFSWIDCNDHAQSVISFVRKSDTQTMVVVLNCTPVVRNNYRIGVPAAGHYEECLNSDAACYGGSNTGNAGGTHSEAVSWMNREHSINLTLPPLGVLILRKC